MKNPLCAICKKPIHSKPSNSPDRFTREHVIPFSWYPDSTPENAERWTVPSHFRCNNQMSKDEQYVFQKLATAIDSTMDGGEGIWDRVMRGLNPAAGKSPSDAMARERARSRLLKDFVPIADATPEMISNAFCAPTNDDPAPEMILIDAARFRRVFRKVFDCCFYRIFGEPPTGDYKWEYQLIGKSQFSDAWEQRGQLLAWQSIGPGVAIGFADLREGTERGTIFQILLWQSVMVEGKYRLNPT